MSSTARYVSGDCRPTPVKCDPNFPIEVGDLLFFHPTQKLVRPASAMINQGSEVLNQGAFHDQFIGVALQKNGAQSGETLPLYGTVNHSPANVIEVATAGRFLFTCAATAWQPGDLVGPSNNTGGTALLNQTVKGPVANTSLAIGRAAPGAAEIGVSLTQVIVEIQSTIFGGGPQTLVPGSSSGPV